MLIPEIYRDAFAMNILYQDGLVHNYVYQQDMYIIWIARQSVEYILASIHGNILSTHNNCVVSIEGASWFCSNRVLCSTLLPAIGTVLISANGRWV